MNTQLSSKNFSRPEWGNGLKPLEIMSLIFSIIGVSLNLLHHMARFIPICLQFVATSHLILQCMNCMVTRKLGSVRTKLFQKSLQLWSQCWSWSLPKHDHWQVQQSLCCSFSGCWWQKCWHDISAKILSASWVFWIPFAKSIMPEWESSNVQQECHAGAGKEANTGCADTPGFTLWEEPKIVHDKCGFKHVELSRNNKHVVQSSLDMLQSWRGNCDFQLMLYASDPFNPDPAEIVRITNYIVAYARKGNVSLAD